MSVFRYHMPMLQTYLTCVAAEGDKSTEGNAEALFNLGARYGKGQEFPQSDKIANEFMMLAAIRGLERAKQYAEPADYEIILRYEK